MSGIPNKYEKIAPCLYARILACGSRTYFIKKIINGRHVHRTFPTEALAREFLDKFGDKETRGRKIVKNQRRPNIGLQGWGSI